MPDLLALNGQIIGGVPLPAKNYVKLWENQDPTANFGPQTIDLSSDDYDFLFITCFVKNNSNYSFSVTSQKGNDIYLSFASVGAGASGTSRILTYVNNTSYSVQDAYQATGTTMAAVDNTRLIPTAIYAIKKDALATEGGGVGGGHIIEDSEGTDLDQQDTLQFKGTLRAINDAQNGKTIVDDSAVEIEWDDWQAMTEQEREAYLAENPKVDILNFPDASGEIDVELFTKLWENPNPTSSFGLQTVDLSSDDYDFLFILSRNHATGGENDIATFARKGAGAIIFYSNAQTNGTLTARRYFSYTSDTKVTFDETQTLQGSGTTPTTNNSFLVPIAIYGFKKKVTVGVDAIAENVSTSASKCIMPDGETTVAQAIENIGVPTLVASPMVLNTYYNIPRQAKDIIIFFTNSSGNSWSTVFPMIEDKLLVIGSEELSSGLLPYVVINITNYTVMLGRIGTGSSAKLYWR